MSNSFSILFGVTGSVASIKLIEILKKLQFEGRNQSIDLKVKVITTSSARKFESFWESLECYAEVYYDEDEWFNWNSKGDKILHIELRKWADMFIICPLSANTLAKISNGLCDNLLTCTARAWSPKTKPLLVFPSMNTEMWNHPITVQQINTVESFNIKVIEPITKMLACGDFGIGAIPETNTIVSIIFREIKSKLQVS